jgi:hypothetical protein
MVFSISIEQPPDHPLILRVVSPRLVLEKLDAAFAQCDRDLDPLISKHKVLRTGKEVRNDLQPSERFARVLDLLAHNLTLLALSPVPGAEDSDDVITIRESNRHDGAFDHAETVVSLLA